MALAELLQRFQVVLVFFLGVLVAFLSWAVMMRVRQLVEDKAKATDLVSLGSHVQGLEARVVTLELAFRGMPGGEHLRDIQVALADIRGELKAGNERFRGLESLLEQHGRQVETIDQFLRKVST